MEVFFSLNVRGKEGVEDERREEASRKREIKGERRGRRGTERRDEEE